MFRRGNQQSIQQLEVTLKQAQNTMREVAEKLSVLAIEEKHVSMVGRSPSSSPELPHPLTDSTNSSGTDSEQEDIGVFTVEESIVVEENEVMFARSQPGRR